MTQRRALLSVYDKTGLLDYARALVALGVELVGSGGTARALQEAGLPVTPVEALTGYPELLGGRVKTLHPAIHGGLLARRTPEHLAELAAQGLAPIDLVVCSLYPFERTVGTLGVTEAEAIEQIDIGGVTLLRAAAKNHESVTVVCDPADYPTSLEELAQPNPARRRALALKAFRHTAAYDAAIATWLAEGSDPDPVLPQALNLAATRVQALRYGENPHQRAALYRLADSPWPYTQLQGKELSYNNLVDMDAAWAIPLAFDEPCVAIIKHTNPCGLALGPTATAAFERALACDPVSAFGSIIAVNREIDEDFAQALGRSKLFVEVLVAPGYTPGALERLARRANCRVMQAARSGGPARVLRGLRGGLLVQTPDDPAREGATWRVVSSRAPSPEELEQLRFAWQAVRFVRSNAIVLVRDHAAVGVGAGQMNRVDSVRLAVSRAGARAQGSVLGSDAFFPFADGVEAAAAAGVTAVIQPGGSVRDEEVIATAERLGLAMIFTGERHFLH